MWELVEDELGLEAEVEGRRPFLEEEEEEEVAFIQG